MIIPTYLKNIFNEIDSLQKDGKFSKKECEKFKNDKNSVFNEFFDVEAGMSLETFVLKNLHQPGIRECVQLKNNNNFKSGRFLADKSGKMVKTNLFRKTIKDDINAEEVIQGECKILKYSDSNRALQTFNISTCVAVTIYNRKTKTGFLAHIDTANRAKSLKPVLKELSFKPEDVEVRIFGGMIDQSEGTLEIINEILRENKLKIVEQDVLAKDKSYAIQLDLETGEVYDYIEKTSSELKIAPKKVLKTNF